MSGLQNRVSRAFQYIADNEERFVQELQEFLSFPSISAQSTHNTDVRQCARWLQNHLANIGLETRLIETKGHPIVWAWGKGNSSKTLIIYGHYDVQPEDPIEQWRSDPFKPCIREGYIYARGATDDKGPLFAHIKAIESLIRTEGGLPCNVLFLVEGEEESGGTGLSEYIIQHQAEIQADAVLVSDTAMYGENTPAITYGLRGLLAIEVTMRTTERDLHSGIFGGAIANPATLLSQIISKCVTIDGRITVPGFYDRVKVPEPWEKENIERLVFDPKTFLEQAGSKQAWGEADFSILERLWTRPTLEVDGMISGYTGVGMKTIIPASATAKISVRLVPDQHPKRILNLLTQHIHSLCPNWVDITVQGPVSSAKPIIFDVNDPVIRIGCEALKAGFGIDPVFIRAGSSVPVVNAFWDSLKKPVILMGLGLESDGAHSPNEHFRINNLVCGTRSSAYLMVNL